MFSTRDTPAPMDMAPGLFGGGTSATLARAKTFSFTDRSFPMISAIVQFKLPDSPSLEQVKPLFESTAPRYRGMAGLIRKY